MLSLTDSAASAIRQLTQQAGMSEDTGLRIAAAASGDGQPVYEMAVVSAPMPTDSVVENEGARVFLDPPATAEFDNKLLDASVDEGTVRFQMLPDSE